MASGKTTAWANSLLNLILGATAFSAPANIFAAIFTVTPTAAGGGTEATGGGYSRTSVTNNTTNWPNASAGVKSNGAAISWAAASGNWSAGSNQVGAALLDASSAGNMFYFGDLTVAKAVNTGDTPSFAIAALSVTET